MLRLKLLPMWSRHDSKNEWMSVSKWDAQLRFSQLRLRKVGSEGCRRVCEGSLAVCGDKYFMKIVEVIGNLAQHLPIAEPLKHEKTIRNLTTRITRAANKPTVTQHDLKIATDRFKTNQKRANLQHTNKVRLTQARNKSA